jgi:hypothetical protein
MYLRNNQIFNYIIGFSLIIVNSFWVAICIHFLIVYHLHHTSFVSQIPDWVLIMNAVLGASGILVGIKVIQNKIIIPFGVLIQIALIIIGLLVQKLAIS